MGRLRASGPYPILSRLFFVRFFDQEALSPQADAAANLGPLLGLLAVPGAFFGLLLQPLTIRGWDLVTFRYYFLSFTMIAMAFLVVLKWEALFPDLRDYQVLTPLPLRPRTLFFSKLVAFALFLSLFLVDINLFAMFFWPGIDQGPNVLNLLGAHIVAIGSAGLFAALAAAAVQGVLATFLSGRAFRRVSACIQMALMAALIMLLFLTPLTAMSIRGLVKAHGPLLTWFPGFWFAGLYERLRPVTGNPLLADLGRMAIRALGFVGAAFLLTYLPGYRRHARIILEGAPTSAAGPGRLRSVLGAALNRTVLRNPVERAVFHFISQTIARSMKHRIFLATYGGFGAALGMLSLLSGDSGLLRLPLTLSFVMVSGLRAAFNFPSELRANWAFRLSETSAAGAYVSAMRKWVALYAVAPLFLLLAPIELHFFRWPVALFHVAYGVALSLLLGEIMFFGFRKVAFTCSYFPGRINLVWLSVIYVMGFTTYISTMSDVEVWLSSRPAAALAFLALAAAAGVTAAWWRDRQFGLTAKLNYEDLGDPTVLTLDLASR
jgi:hypothetical protein